MRLVITGILALVISIMVSTLKNDIRRNQKEICVPSFYSIKIAESIFCTFPQELKPFFYTSATPLIFTEKSK